jgi:hypothetical protein
VFVATPTGVRGEATRIAAHRRASPTPAARRPREHPCITRSHRTEEMLALTLLSSIAQSRVGQWLRALPRRTRH